ncbi:KDO2-lipid IV(A) lauroyltransferase [Tranquillimonas rosea]|uniref:KDO2-lipid IV(A) lauroyltransferase n=2 Tax=Tranquillimonas rosea TaxID=641238 RepID=A0A1H9PVX3_9RHOB|nr:KDO2-lipid IV(A) lauroyltransferase [Tranquillimonas rosea]
MSGGAKRAARPGARAPQTTSKRMAKTTSPRRQALEDRVVRAVLWVAARLPYRWRVPVLGWLTSRVAAPLLGWNKRVRENLAYVLPDLPEAEIVRIVRAVPDNAGRSLAELYSGAEFLERVGPTPLRGPGVETLEAGLRARTPMVLVTGHFGNYDAFRAVMKHRGEPLGALYRPMRNAALNDRYVQAMAQLSSVHAADRKGIVAIMRHLKNGEPVAVVSDIYAEGGLPVTFFGKTAPTAGSIAEWAVKFDAPMIPIFSIRQDDGLSFDIVVEEPIPHGTVEEMMQTYNDRVEAQARAHPGQWFWIHRRWKPHRQRARAAATTGP